MGFDDKKIKKFFNQNEIDQARFYLKNRLASVDSRTIESLNGFTDLNNFGQDISQLSNHIINSLPDDKILNTANQCIMADNVEVCKQVLLEIPTIYGETVSFLTIDIASSLNIGLIYSCIEKDIKPYQTYLYINRCKNTAFFNHIKTSMIKGLLRGYIANKENSIYIRIYPMPNQDGLLELVRAINRYY